MTDATRRSDTDTILFGAFDRHNFGDLLFPHVLARMLPGRHIRFAGLRERDLRPCGGHLTEAVSKLAASDHDRAFDIVHAGGELLTCDAWEAAVMLASEEQVKPMIEDYSAWEKRPTQWAREHVGLSTRAPYVLSRTHCPHGRRFIFNAVGGVDLDHRAPEMVADVIEALRQAEDVTVRDVLTQRILEQAGIATRLLPDPAVMVAELFGDVIGHHANGEAISAIRDACPNGYLAVQFSADFGDDRTLEAIAGQLDDAAGHHGLGIAFFCAGMAPWHDDLEVYARTRRFMRTPSPPIMTSSNVWDVCALIAKSRGYCGSSLHGRIVASAFALPRVNIRHPGRPTAAGKPTAFARTWEDADMPDEVGADQIVRGIDDALRVESERFKRIATTLASEYRAGFSRVEALLA